MDLHRNTLQASNSSSVKYIVELDDCVPSKADAKDTFPYLTEHLYSQEKRIKQLEDLSSKHDNFFQGVVESMQELTNKHEDVLNFSLEVENHLRSRMAACIDELRLELLDELEHRCPKNCSPVLSPAGIDHLRRRSEEDSLQQLQKSDQRKDGVIGEPPEAVFDSSSSVDHSLSFKRFLEVETLQWELCESTFDSSLLIFTENMSRTDSISLALALVITIFLQLVFALVLTSASFTESNLPSLDSIRRWRVVEAHNYQYTNGLSRNNLATRVCGMDASLVVSSYQQELLYLVQLYTESLHGMGAEAGILLCLAALCTFALTVHVTAWQRAAQMMLAIAVVPTGSSTRLVLVQETPASGFELDLQSLYVLRRISIILICIVELSSAYALLGYGCIWLSRTVHVTELVLNATALGFVLEIDELIFQALVPHRACLELRRVKALRLPNPYKIMKIFPQVLCLATVLVALIFSNFAILKDQLQHMKDIEETMCSGNTSVVYTIIPGVSLVTIANSVPYGDSDSQVIAEIKRNLPKAIWGTGSDDDSDFAIFVESWLEFEKVALHGAERLGTTTICEDAFFGGSDHVENTMKTMYNASANNCGDLVSFCDGGDSSFLVRAMCPVTCGCLDPIDGLIARTIDLGCPLDVCRSTLKFFEYRRDQGCEDLNTKMLSQGQSSLTLGWNRYFDGIYANSVAKTWFGLGMIVQAYLDGISVGNNQSLNTLDYVELARSSGCKFLGFLRDFPASSVRQYSHLAYHTLCHGNPRFAGLIAFCPITCQCGPEVADCPLSCNS